MSLPVKIIDHLYLGNLSNAENKSGLFSLDIWSIIDLSCEEYEHGNIDKENIFTIHIMDFSDSMINQYFKTTFDFIEKRISKGENVLVHCLAGRSRSPTIVIAYLIKKYKWSFEMAYLHVKKLRTAIDPNVGFVSQLLQYEKEILNLKFQSYGEIK